MRFAVFLSVLSVHEIVSSDQCGLPIINPRKKGSKIVGGTVAERGSWPWQVGIWYQQLGWFGPSLGLVCGGSIINTRYILTAAHCVQHDQNPNKFIVTAGDYDMDVYEQSEQNFEIKRIVIYPGYDDSTTNNDLALLELNSPLQFNGEISPICLPIAGFDPISETRCYATGWGDSQPYEGRNAFERSAATRARPLQQVEVDIIKRETCRIKYPGLISEQMICAGFDIGGRDPCQADSGGPLTCRNSTGVFEIVGIISWGHGCGWPNQPGVYTRVGSFVDWINQYSGT